jgi:hypothetical protein
MPFSTGEFSQTDRYVFEDDSDDTIGGSSNNVGGDSFFSYDVTLTGTAYLNLGRQGTGDRYQFVKSVFDFRLIAASAYSFAPQFAMGVACAGSGGGLTIGDSALDNATYELMVIGDGYATGTFSSSDIRLKKNIRNLENSLDKITALRGVMFNWKVDEFPKKKFKEGDYLGFIAQEVEEVIPEVVKTEIVSKRATEEYKSIDYAKLIPHLVESIKQLKNEVDELKEKLKDG